MLSESGIGLRELDHVIILDHSGCMETAVSAARAWSEGVLTMHDVMDLCIAWIVHSLLGGKGIERGSGLWEMAEKELSEAWELVPLQVMLAEVAKKLSVAIISGEI